MNPIWRSFLESAEAVFDGDSGEVLHFGDAAAELSAADKQTVLVPLTHLALIEAEGEDAQAFLHGQLTSDVNHLGDGKAQHAGWCTAKGRMQASFLVVRRSARYGLVLAADLAEPTLKRLKMFVLRAKVALQGADATVLLGLAGPQAADALADAGLPVPTETLTAASAGESTVIRLDDARFIIFSPVSELPVLWQKLGVKARPAGNAAWRWLDIRAAYPLVTLATKEEFVPQMADFEKIGGVSFHKGCYPGQEVVARTQYLGKVKRHLYRLASAQPLKAGDTLHSAENPDQACGTVMTAAPAPGGGYAALAVVQSNYAASIRLGSVDGPLLQASAVNP